MGNGRGVLALTADGRLTYCKADPDKRGQGNCNHVAHLKEGQEVTDFIRENSERVKIQPYRMSILDKSRLQLINGRVHLADKDNDGGYIELTTPVWSPANLREFAAMEGVKYTPSYMRAVINGKKEINGKTGVQALNDYAESMGYEATKDIYVIPYRYRQDLENAKNPINALYNAVLTSRSNPQKNQEAYDRLLDNEKVYQKYGMQPLGHRGNAYQSLGGRIAGKKGIMRGYMSGYTVMNSAHLVISPCKELNADEIGVPPHVCAELWRDDLYKHMTEKGAPMTRTRDWLEKMRDKSYEPTDADINRLDKEMQEMGAKCLVDRSPDLHMGSMPGCYVRVNGALKTTTFGIGSESTNASKHTFMMNPSYYKGMNADNDGDMTSIVKVYVDDQEFNDTFTVNSKFVGNNPKNLEQSMLTPTRDSLFGLFNLLLN